MTPPPPPPPQTHTHIDYTVKSFLISHSESLQDAYSGTFSLTHALAQTLIYI